MENIQFWSIYMSDKLLRPVCLAHQLSNRDTQRLLDAGTTGDPPPTRRTDARARSSLRALVNVALIRARALSARHLLFLHEFLLLL